MTGSSKPIYLDSSDTHNQLIMGTSGTGKSYFLESSCQAIREKGGLWVCTDDYVAGRNLRPFEYELSRRVYLGLDGRLPRGLRNKKMTLCVGQTKQTRKTKRIAIHLVKTKHALLTRQLIQRAIDELDCQTSVTLNHPQIIGLMERHELDKKIEEFGEVETQIRGYLADALSTELLSLSWPTYGDDIDMDSFWKRIYRAAIEAGYRAR